MAPNTPLLAFCNCQNNAEAERLGHWLVNDKLAACVNILPTVQSIYRWQGQVEQASEVSLLIKTNAAMLAQIKAQLSQQHSYELPELIAVEITDGLAPYLHWLQENLEDDITP